MCETGTCRKCNIPAEVLSHAARSRLLAVSDTAETAAAGRLDANDVAGLERAGDLARQLLAVQHVPPPRPGFASVDALRGLAPPLADQREPTRLQHAQLAHDAVAAAVPALTTGAEAQLVPLDPQRIRDLERLAEGCEEDVDDPARRLHVAGGYGGRRACVHERACGGGDGDRGEGATGGRHVRIGEAADDEVAGRA